MLHWEPVHLCDFMTKYRDIFIYVDKRTIDIIKSREKSSRISTGNNP